MTRRGNKWGSGGKPLDLPPLIAPDDVRGALPCGVQHPEGQVARKDKIAKRLAFVLASRQAGYRDKEIRIALGIAHSSLTCFLVVHGIEGRRRFNRRRAND